MEVEWSHEHRCVWQVEPAGYFILEDTKDYEYWMKLGLLARYRPEWSSGWKAWHRRKRK